MWIVAPLTEASNFQAIPQDYRKDVIARRRHESTTFPEENGHMSPNTFQTKLRILGLAAATFVAATTFAIAQDYPHQRVTIIVPFSAGSISDGFARILVNKLGEMWKQQVIVENRPGLPGTAAVAKAAPDGYTLMVTSNGHTIASAINKSPQFDPIKDFAGISLVGSVPLVVIVPPDLPVKNVRDFIALAKEKPGTLNFSSAGVASTTYLSTEIFKQNAKIDIQHIPHRGAPEALAAVIRGEAQLFMATIPVAQELVAANKVRTIAINSAKRVPQLPDVPTIAESGLPDYKYDSWFGMMAPAGTPKTILDKVSQDIAKVMQMPDVSTRLNAQGSVATTSTPEQFDAVIKSDTERYAKILKDAGISPQ
jgi:tripartite-type tricarboxylate transporter receptor subunit TctC